MMVVEQRAVVIIRLSSPPLPTFASTMAGLPDENLIELLLHLKVGARTLPHIPRLDPNAGLLQ